MATSDTPRPKRPKGHPPPTNTNSTSPAPLPKGIVGGKDTNAGSLSTWSVIDSPHIFTAVFILVMISVFIILFIILSMTIKCICKNKGFKAQISHKSGRNFVLLFISMLLCFLATNIMLLQQMCIDVNNMDNISLDNYDTFSPIIRLTYKTGRCLMMIFFILRVKLCFQKSVIQIKNWKLYILAAFTILSEILTVVGCMIELLDNTNKQPNTGWNIGQGFISSFVFDVVVFCIVSWLFVHGLLRIITNDQLDNDNSLMQTVAKNTTLAIFGFLSSLGPEAWVLYTRYMHTSSFVMGGGGDAKSANINSIGPTGKGAGIVVQDPIIMTMFMCLDGSINCICVYLLFSFMKPTYGCICKWCNICALKCCIKVARKTQGVPINLNFDNKDMELKVVKSNGMKQMDTNSKNQNMSLSPSESKESESKESCKSVSVGTCTNNSQRNENVIVPVGNDSIGSKDQQSMSVSDTSRDSEVP